MFSVHSYDHKPIKLHLILIVDHIIIYFLVYCIIYIRFIYVTFFLLFKGVKLLYFTHSIVNFTALNLPGITSLHLLTTRVGLLLLKSVRLFLQTTGVA